ncbi:oxidoreductase, short chain dehydrogenase/reductase family (plasmid) [Phenylobacterium zucineum HLK1]|uniref:D-xylose 1-dehydrogenase n=1 Tax=Phenylobacterium zucineum (strain HLK1) TaxID=450851 RepID=B4RI65_PHEZH|nr:SDR family oxidoreductase [Phenylobacterium zucineum]ACG80040.1 oxidoreductase, short chain dehydrogenase/reductase family [Phenylobacterium zucineum HLK1]
MTELQPPFPDQSQTPPGTTSQMEPKPDHGEHSYKGSGRLAGKAALITGGDSGIGRAVAIAFAREGADVAIGYLNEHDDAEETRRWVETAGRRCLLLPGDLADPAHCRALVEKTVSEFGRLDVLVNNAAEQATYQSLDEITEEAWARTFQVNIHAMFHLAKAALPHLKPGSAIINTTSVNADDPNPSLLPYATTKGAIQNFTAGLAQMLAEKGVRVNCVAPGPIWTPLIPATMPPEKVKQFGANTPMKRPGQPKEVAPVYVLLASDEASYVSGATVAVTGGRPML